jgi:hypothetical protein
MIAVALSLWRLWPRQPTTGAQAPTEVNGIAPESVAASTSAPTNASAPAFRRSKIKHRASEFTDQEKAAFAANFDQRYKPVVVRWCNTFAGHVPVAAEDVTAGSLVERIGKDSTYNEYIFVVHGITLGVRDSKGVAECDYLNDPQQTRKLAVLPQGDEHPVVTSPVTREEIMNLVEADGGTQFPPQQVRMTPSGLSGSLNGGVLVSVGGDARNGASWKYDMVFGPDGKLAYFLRGPD